MPIAAKLGPGRRHGTVVMAWSAVCSRKTDLIQFT
jgi:hypothetical protein